MESFILKYYTQIKFENRKNTEGKIICYLCILIKTENNEL